MDIYFLNTQSGTKEKFEPLEPDRITMYVCGPTVYDFVHIGNGRPAVVFDVLYRLLQSVYPTVDYVRNVTDIEDKINRAALERGEPISALTDRFKPTLDNYWSTVLHTTLPAPSNAKLTVPLKGNDS